MLFRSVAKHSIFLFHPSTQRGRILHFLTILVRITSETRLLPTWFWRNAGLVLVLFYCHFSPSLFARSFSSQRPLQSDRCYQCRDDDHDNNCAENRRANHGLSPTTRRWQHQRCTDAREYQTNLATRDHS